MPFAGMPEGHALFLNDGEGGYALDLDDISVRVEGEADGPVYVRVSVRGAGAAKGKAEAGFEAPSLDGFRTRFQDMVALAHDGTPARRNVDWGPSALWLASVPWALDDAPR